MMATMPMHAAIKPHIEADQHQARRAELDGQIDGLEPAVAAAADLADTAEQQTVHGADVDRRQTVAVGAVALSEPLAWEVGRAAPRGPPFIVTGVESGGPRREPPAVVDC